MDANGANLRAIADGVKAQSTPAWGNR
jgi:hypothetical protein